VSSFPICETAGIYALDLEMPRFATWEEEEDFVNVSILSTRTQQHPESLPFNRGFNPGSTDFPELSGSLESTGFQLISNTYTSEVRSPSHVSSSREEWKLLLIVPSSLSLSFIFQFRVTQFSGFPVVTFLSNGKLHFQRIAISSNNWVLQQSDIRHSYWWYNSIKWLLCSRLSRRWSQRQGLLVSSC